jgi:hypothetical protein
LIPGTPAKASRPLLGSVRSAQPRAMLQRK